MKGAANRVAKVLSIIPALASLALGQMCLAAEGGEAFHKLIDKHIEAGWKERKVSPAKAASDAEFLRRVSLDLAGIIPTAAETRVFLDDKAGDKRVRLIDRLLASPEYALHMARVFDVMLAERRVPAIKSYDIKGPVWRAFLTDAFAENRPWNDLARDILSSDGSDKETGAGVKFFLVRGTEAHVVTRDVSRLFLGRDIQCAQCHDDPRYKDYKQADYFGIYAFLNRTSHFLEKKSKQSMLAEKADGDVSFTSVFTGKKGDAMPKLPGREKMADPEMEKDKRYKVAPGKDARAVPAYSRRLKLAKSLPQKETNGFSLNIANRLWALMMGRGLVHPLDMHHDKNPPSHPELLEALALHMEETNYDIKAFLRQVALSRVYQLSSQLPEGQSEPSPEAFGVAQLHALSAEQLGWNFLQASQRLPESILEAEQKLKKEDPEHYEQRRRDMKWKKGIYDGLEKTAQPLIAAFANMPGQAEGDFAPTVGQALFLLNGQKLFTLASGSYDGSLIARLKDLKTTDEIADELFLSVLTRRPVSEERKEVAQFLEKRKDREAALQELTWAKLLSAEFRLKH
ncbi:MAG: DUF1549 domain-containing protein [Verrucomicrobiota bacterium]